MAISDIRFVSTGLFALTWIIFYLVYAKRLDGMKVHQFFAATLFLFCFEYFFLGPYSFVHFDDEADVSISIFNYLNNRPIDGTFAHEPGGGLHAT